MRERERQRERQREKQRERESERETFDKSRAKHAFLRSSRQVLRSGALILLKSPEANLVQNTPHILPRWFSKQTKGQHVTPSNWAGHGCVNCQKSTHGRVTNNPFESRQQEGVGCSHARDFPRIWTVTSRDASGSSCLCPDDSIGAFLGVRCDMYM